MYSLEKVVPWGRSFDEYRRMFALTDADLTGRLLACADGPAGFNAVLTAAGGHVTSCDPLYRFSKEEIRQRIDESSAEIIEQTRKNRGEFVWSREIPDVDALIHRRFAAMGQFLNDYDAGKVSGRYVAAELPTLPFAAHSFDLAICSHFLFLYGGQLSAGFHVNSIRELIRVAGEVRIFPLVELGTVPSRHVAFVTKRLHADGYRVMLETVDYEFQRGANQMMRICK